jgi:hypothetical protein
VHWLGPELYQECWRPCRDAVETYPWATTGPVWDKVVAHVRPPLRAIRFALVGQIMTSMKLWLRL